MMLIPTEALGVFILVLAIAVIAVVFVVLTS